MDTGAVPTSPCPALVLDFSLLSEACDETGAVMRVFIEIQDIGIQCFFYGTKPEHPDERRVASKYPTIRGGEEVPGEIVLEEAPVTFFTLLQGILYGLQRGVLAPERLVLSQEPSYAFIDRPLFRCEALLSPRSRSGAGRTL